jgi:DnaJ family protein B protein 8
MMNYYEILGVSSSATPTEIRKAYLKCSLKHHPDKNPSNVQEAQAKFVEIGRAYEVLKDETSRREYDREYQYQYRGGGNSSSGGGGGNSSGFSSGFGGGSGASAGAAGGGDTSSFDFDDSQAYENYRDFFDETVAGMSEADLATAIGAAAMIGSLVGSLVGSRLAHGATTTTSHGTRGGGAGGGAGAGSGILTTAGSMVGSMVASEMAASSVRSLHRSSIQRLEYKQACRIAAERGQPLPQPPAASPLDQFFGTAVQAVKNATQNPDKAAQSFGKLWNKARAGMNAATAFADANTHGTGSTGARPSGSSGGGGGAGGGGGGGGNPTRTSFGGR